jgi:hypothetical protein
MRKAKSKSNKKVNSPKIVDVIDEKHINLHLKDDETLKLLNPELQRLAYAMHGSTNQLIQSHNLLIESARGQSQKNQHSIFTSALVLESQIDFKIEQFNNLVDVELDRVYDRQDAKRKAKRKKLSKSPRAKKMRKMRKTESKAQKAKRLKNERSQKAKREKRNAKANLRDLSTRKKSLRKAKSQSKKRA